MSFDLVLFGGTGDLTWRKLMPALFQAYRHGKLPEGRFPCQNGNQKRSQSFGITSRQGSSQTNR